MSGREFVEWMAFNNIFPFGEDRADFRIARNTNFITNILIRLLGGKKSKQITAEKFLLQIGDHKKPEKTTEQLLSKATFLNKLLGGVDLRKKKK